MGDYGFAMNAVQAPSAKFSFSSLIALAAAIASFFVGAGLGMILAVVAILFGALGVLLSFSSRTRGGFVSTLSIAAGFLGIVVAAVKAVLWLMGSSGT
jgi:hypothetical protein